jgi:hypothetical protein
MKMANEKRLIDANVLEKALQNTAIRFPVDKGNMFKLIEDAPTVDAVEVVHGQWIELPTPRTMWKYRCDKCGCPQDYKHNYCPNCGAKMDGDWNA